MTQRKISWQFVPLPVAMLESPAFRRLSLSARRILDRLEIEHARHASKDNGRLTVTYEDFVKYGVRERLISAALRELVELGFIVITHADHARAGQIRPANVFRLTYLPTEDAEPTNDWQRIATAEQAAKRRAVARRPRSQMRRSPPPRLVQITAECA